MARMERIIACVFLVIVSLLHVECGRSSNCGEDTLKLCKCELDYTLNHKIVDCSNTGMVSVPKCIPPDTTHLYLDSNNFVSLASGAFAPGLPNLETLSISNNLMKKMMPDSLAGLDSLINLFLYNNSLGSSDSLPNTVFYPVNLSLQVLDIRRNLLSNKETAGNYPKSVGELSNLIELRLDCIRNKSLPREYSELKNLRKLEFSDGGTDVKLLHEAMFDSLTRLKITDIELSNLGITYVWNSTFSKLHTLKKLDISHNPGLGSAVLNLLSSVQKTPIQQLILNNTGLGIAPVSQQRILDALCSLNRTLKRLCLDHNNMHSFDVNVRACFPKMELLSLADNYFPLTQKIIYEVFMLKHLVGYNLSWQEAVTISDFNRHKRRLQFCENGQACPIYLPPNLRWIDASHGGMRFSLVPEMAFLSNVSMESLKMTHDGVQTFRYPIYCAKDRNIHIHITEVNLRNNALRCMNSTIFDHQITSCKGSMQYGYLGGNRLGSVEENDCNEDKTDVLGFLKPLHNLKGIELSNNLLDSNSSISVLGNLHQLQFLDLASNRFVTFSLNLTNLTQLKILDLSFNQIQCLSKSTISQLDILVKSKLPTEHLQLDLSGNMLSCTCECLHFFNWMTTTKVHLLHNKTYQCISEEGLLYPLKNMMEVDARMRGLCHGTKWLTIYVLLEISIFTAISAATLLFRARHSIWYVYLKMKINRNKLRALLKEKQYTFSAFVSCDARDAKYFVKRKLLPTLETEDTQLKFCVAQRNFLVGAPIVQNIFRAIHKSWKSIFIVSKYFLQSRWCEEELLMAHQVRSNFSFLLFSPQFSLNLFSGWAASASATDERNRAAVVVAKHLTFEFFALSTIPSAKRFCHKKSF